MYLCTCIIFFSGKPAIQAFTIIQIFYHNFKELHFFSNLLNSIFVFGLVLIPLSFFCSEIPYKKLSSFTLLARSKMVYLVYVLFFFQHPSKLLTLKYLAKHVPCSIRPLGVKYFICCLLCFFLNPSEIFTLNNSPKKNVLAHFARSGYYIFVFCSVFYTS